MPQPYFVKGLIGKVLAYGGLQIRKYIPHGLQIPADKVTPCTALRAKLCWLFLFRWLQFVIYRRAMRTIFPHVLKAFAKAAFSK